MYKCKNNNDCNNEHLCCVSCEKLRQCLRDNIACENLSDGESEFKCQHMELDKREELLMEKVKISTLSKDTIVFVEGNSTINTVEDILNDTEYYKGKEVYTTTPHYASFDAEYIMDNIIEDEYNNGMYEDWDDSISADVTKEDIEDLQKIFDRILARNPMSNIAYESDKLIEFDI